MFFLQLFCLTLKTLGQVLIALSHQFNIQIEIKPGFNFHLEDRATNIRLVVLDCGF
jgi:hypothetical protein